MRDNGYTDRKSGGYSVGCWRGRKLLATKPPKLRAVRQEQLRRLAATAEPVRELAAAFGIGRATAYRYLAGQ
jgi:hypothetical protein